MLQQITSDNFYEVLNRFSLHELENMIEKYPYFEHAHLLLAKKYQLEKSPKFDEQLQMAVLYTQDREFLFTVFNEEQVKTSETYFAAHVSPVMDEEVLQQPKTAEEEIPTVVEPINSELTQIVIEIEEEVANTPAVTEKDLDNEVEPENISLHEIEEEYDHEADDDFTVAEPHTFDEWLHAFNKPLLPESVTKPIQISSPIKQDEELNKLIMESVPVNLLHDLVEEETNYSRGLDRFIEEQIQKHKHVEKREPAPETEINPDIITETLAKVYEMQKKYNKAIKAYEVLSLKFPEKNDFFAARINYLKKLDVIMYAFVTIIIVLLGILLGAVVLIQNPKGGGLSGSFGGVGQQLLGARRSTDVIEKLTWGFAAGLLFLCLATSLFIGKGTTTVKTEKSIIEQEQTKSGNGFTPNAPAQGQGGNGAAPSQQAPASGDVPK